MLRNKFSSKIPVHPVVGVQVEVIENAERVAKIIGYPGSVMNNIRRPHISYIVKFETRRS
jgi:hypothetical protein